MQVHTNSLPAGRRPPRRPRRRAPRSLLLPLTLCSLLLVSSCGTVQSRPACPPVFIPAELMEEDPLPILLP